MFFPIGIDHDGCMKGVVTEDLKINYRAVAPIHKPFQNNLGELVSEEALNKYTLIMKEFNIDPEAIKWMKIGAAVIRNAIQNGKTGQHAIQIAKQIWQKKFITTTY